MYNLLVLIKKYHSAIVFVVLELLCIIMIVNSLPYQSRKMVSVSNRIAGRWYRTMANWNDYMNLKTQNEILAENNAMLMNQLENVTASSDSLIINEIYTFMPAHVIKNTINKTNNYILIDKGAADGIEPDLGVICDNGVVGKIVNVSTHFASVMSLLNSYSVVSCRFIDNQYIANVVWDNMNYQYGVVQDIPSHLVINKGDTLVTSGYSNMFPPDVKVGVVEEYYYDENEMFSKAKLKFLTNFSTLRHVYVVKNNYKAELDSLCITH